MKSNLGQTLRTIRKGKQMTLEELSDKHLSISQISRFERGESEISTARLINILDKLNISMEEFLIVYNQDSTHVETFSNLIQYIVKSYISQNIDNIKELLANSHKHQLNSFEITMIKSLIFPFDSSFKPTDEELLELTDYLFKVEKWGYYEITLLGNCVRTINYKTFFLLTTEMLENYIYSSLNKTNKKLVTQLALNCLIASIDEQDYKNCRFLIKKIEKLLLDELNFYEKTVFIYVTGYYDYKSGDRQGCENMKKAIHIFELLDETNLANAYREHYNKFVKET